jgi:hypothetical protein
MGLFDFFKSKTNENGMSTQSYELQNENSINEDKIVDRNLFIKDPNKNQSELNIPESTAWRRIFNRIRFDYETEGYNDALCTPDIKYRNDNSEILKLNLSVDIEEAEIEIKEYLKELDFHISSRKKAELVDLVEELEAKKIVYNERIEKLTEIKNDLNNNTGMPNRILLAYNRGFNKGMAALTVANVINKNI